MNTSSCMFSEMDLKRIIVNYIGNVHNCKVKLKIIRKWSFSCREKWLGRWCRGCGALCPPLSASPYPAGVLYYYLFCFLQPYLQDFYGTYSTLHHLPPLGFYSVEGWWGWTVERLYCKMPILCLESSKILTTPPHRLASVCTPPPLVRGEDTLAGWKGDGGSIFWKTPDAALYSTYGSTLWVELRAER